MVEIFDLANHQILFQRIKYVRNTELLNIQVIFFKCPVGHRILI